MMHTSPGMNASMSDVVKDLHTLNTTRSNPNLIDNNYFVGGGSQQGGGQFPINRRGQTSYSSAGYTIDRWEMSPYYIGTAELTASGLVLTGGSTANPGIMLWQKFENLSYGTYTLSCLSDGVLGSGTADINSDTDSIDIAVHSNLNVKLVKDSGRWFVWIWVTQTDVTHTIQAIKLEPGTQQTLAHQDENGNSVLNEIPDYREQLLRCQTSTADAADTYANMNNTVGPKFVCNPNLIINWYLAGKGSYSIDGLSRFPINQRNGLLITPNKNYYTEIGSDTPAGTTGDDEYYALTPTSTTNWYSFVKDGSTFYTLIYFAEPGYIVNYRGGYTVDRWKCSGGRFLLDYAGIILPASSPYGEYSDFIQTMELEQSQKLYGKTVTLSVLTTEGFYSKCGTFATNPPASGNTHAVTFALDGDSTALSYIGADGLVRVHIITRTKPMIVKAVKLELGDAQTLVHRENNKWVLNELPTYDQELSKCQRYYIRVKCYMHFVGSGSVSILPGEDFPVRMRIPPEVVTTSDNEVVGKIGTWGAAEYTSATVVARDDFRIAYINTGEYKTYVEGVAIYGYTADAEI